MDASNIERNLYLTTQLTEMGIPVVVALNMMDIVRRNGDQIDVRKLSQALGCPVVETSAVKGEGCVAAAQEAANLVRTGQSTQSGHTFSSRVEKALKEIMDLIGGVVPGESLRWYAVKFFERDEKVLERFQMGEDLKAVWMESSRRVETELDDDSESIITNERYEYIARVVSGCVKKSRRGMSASDKIDRIVTNRILALPILAAVMYLVYAISMGNLPFSIGSMATGWTNDVLFGAWVPDALNGFLESVGCAPWLQGLIVDGIVAGVGAVLGFVPRCWCCSCCCASWRMWATWRGSPSLWTGSSAGLASPARALSPCWWPPDCGVPGIMASRTIEQDRDPGS